MRAGSATARLVGKARRRQELTRRQHAGDVEEVLEAAVVDGDHADEIVEPQARAERGRRPDLAGADLEDAADGVDVQRQLQLVAVERRLHHGEAAPAIGGARVEAQRTGQIDDGNDPAAQIGDAEDGSWHRGYARDRALLDDLAHLVDRQADLFAADEDRDELHRRLL